MIVLLGFALWFGVMIVVVALCQASGRADRAMSARLTLVRTDVSADLSPVPAPTPSPRGVGQPAGALTFRGLIG